MLKVWKYPLPDLFNDPNLTMGSFKKLPTQDPVNVLCRVYIVRAIELHPTDADGKADPYVRLQLGKQVEFICDFRLGLIFSQEKCSLVTCQ